MLLLLVVGYLASFSKEKSRGESCVSVEFSTGFDPLQEAALVLIDTSGEQLAACLVLSH